MQSTDSKCKGKNETKPNETKENTRKLITIRIRLDYLICFCYVMSCDVMCLDAVNYGSFTFG